ncbi:outer membrane lipoprotein-sorting protein [Alkalimarinus coralli]|uniref:outer membrane lipoprotein-sorting protein n=1 Tax=Alkalimarinus coralli TaxID=2935863 RepID=UPI00202B7131|nr:outer membrane lipoprotein-sorting protein [Alkalimarinus coralli]
MLNALCLIIFWLLVSSAQATENARALITGMETLMWSKKSHGIFTMSIKTQYWQRQLELEAWLDRPNKTFIRIHSPKKEKGVGSLRIGGEMWNYIPKIDRTIKIPPSMMLQPWMGSDFSNDDLVKESSLENDYNHEISESFTQDGKTVYRITSIPKPDAPVVWGKLEFLIYSDFIPLQQSFFDERGQIVKVMNYSDVRVMGGRKIPTRWRMVPQDKTDQFTEIVVKQLSFDDPLDDELFSLRNLRNPK